MQILQNFNDISFLYTACFYINNTSIYMAIDFGNILDKSTSTPAQSGGTSVQNYSNQSTAQVGSDNK